ncbi:MAG: hypothetical protein ABIG40_03180 [Parcubacteria group bacterium]
MAEFEISQKTLDKIRARLKRRIKTIKDLRQMVEPLTKEEGSLLMELGTEPTVEELIEIRQRFPPGQIGKMMERILHRLN